MQFLFAECAKKISMISEIKALCERLLPKIKTNIAELRGENPRVSIHTIKITTLNNIQLSINRIIQIIADNANNIRNITVAIEERDYGDLLNNTAQIRIIYNDIMRYYGIMRRKLDSLNPPIDADDAQPLYDIPL